MAGTGKLGTKQALLKSNRGTKAPKIKLRIVIWMGYGYIDKMALEIQDQILLNFFNSIS